MDIGDLPKFRIILHNILRFLFIRPYLRISAVYLAASFRIGTNLVISTICILYGKKIAHKNSF